MSEVIAYIGLGSNLDGPRSQVTLALRSLARLPQTRCLAQSSLYTSPPMGPQDQPEYINAVACLATTLSAYALLDALQGIERSHGRVRNGTRWGPRTLDLDILIYGDTRVDSPRLRIPHPGMPERAFVLYPLSEIAPADLEVPGLGPLQRLLANCPEAGLRRLERGA